jgi:hypothetical protein
MVFRLVIGFIEYSTTTKLKQEMNSASVSLNFIKEAVAKSGIFPLSGLENIVQIGKRLNFEEK